MGANRLEEIAFEIGPNMDKDEIDVKTKTAIARYDSIDKIDGMVVDGEKLKLKGIGISARGEFTISIYYELNGTDHEKKYLAEEYFSLFPSKTGD